MNRIALPLFVILVAFAGCKQGVDPPLRARADVTDGYGIFLSRSQDEQLRRSTAFNPESVTRDQFGLLSVSIPLRSTGDRTQYLEYQYAFFDAAGIQVEGPLGWTPVTLEAGSPGTIQFTSTSSKAEHFRVTIRYQR